MSSPKERVKAGLCADCLHAERIVSAKGSAFWRCRLSERDPRFPKYPRLPVLECDGYEHKERSRNGGAPQSSESDEP